MHILQVTISFAKIIIISIRPGTETLGKLPGTDTFCDMEQYPMAIQFPGIMIIRVKSALLCFANANFVRERYILSFLLITQLTYGAYVYLYMNSYFFIPNLQLEVG